MSKPLRPVHKVALFAALAIATAFVAHALPPKAAPVPPAPAPTADGRPRIEVTFVLDTTGSMSGLIEGAKQKIWSIASQLASGQPKPEIRMALVAYRDRGDAYVTRVFPLTDDLDAVYGNLLQLRADGGGDTPESVNQALHDAVTRVGWSQQANAYRVIFLVGDAPPHLDYPDDVAFSESLRLAARAGIVVNTVQCGSFAETTPIWQEIARAGRGQYAAIAQDGAMVAVTTPHDDRLASLNRELAETVVAYGAPEQQRELAAKFSLAAEAPPPAAAARLGYLAKTEGRVNSGRADLVDAVKAGTVDPKRIADEDLPEAMRPMSPAEKDAFVQEKLERREKLQQEIAGLAAERESYLRDEQAKLRAAGKGDGFDEKVLDTIRAQSKEKGIAYE